MDGCAGNCKLCCSILFSHFFSGEIVPCPKVFEFSKFGKGIPTFSPPFHPSPDWSLIAGLKLLAQRKNPGIPLDEAFWGRNMIQLGWVIANSAEILYLEGIYYIRPHLVGILTNAYFPLIVTTRIIALHFSIVLSFFFCQTALPCPKVMFG